MGANAEFVSWYDPRHRQQQKFSANQQGKMASGSTENEKDNSGDPIQATDPSTVNLQTSVFNKVAKTFTELFSKDKSRFDRRQETPVGWTTTGELSVLRAEQDAQYEFMEELEVKIEELKKEVEQQKALVKAYEAKVMQSEQYLQHCMHWITMVQVFGDVPVAKDRMNWKPGRDAALVGPDEDHDNNGKEAK